jgi:hypothetical protein
MARPHLLRPQGGEALRRGLEARQAAAEGVKARASRGLAAAAAEAEEEVWGEGWGGRGGGGGEGGGGGDKGAMCPEPTEHVLSPCPGNAVKGCMFAIAAQL